MSAHSKHAAGARIAVPCLAEHITFGGKCLNCGWNPEATGARLLAGLRDGDRVTLRVPEGLFIGRALPCIADQSWRAVHEGHSVSITAENLLCVSRRLS